MQKWNIQTDKAQRVDEKNGVIFLVIMFFIDEDSLTKIKKWPIFCIFSWWQQKVNILKCIWKILFSPFRIFYGLLRSELPLARCQPLRIQRFGIFLLTQLFFYISIIGISKAVTATSINLKKCNKIFQVRLNILPKL